jgi:putative exosortase-associated protein (TIGR04073 family)
MEKQMKLIVKSLLILLSVMFFMSGTAMAEKSHSLKVGEKLGSAIANVSTGFVEIPKTIYVSGKENGMFYGATAGFITGIMHTIGRTLCGTMDLVTFMIPTQSLVRPEYIWNDFGKETSYSTNWQMRR